MGRCVRIVADGRAGFCYRFKTTEYSVSCVRHGLSGPVTRSRASLRFTGRCFRFSSTVPNANGAMPVRVPNHSKGAEDAVYPM